MNCLYCEKKIEKFNFNSLFLEDDYLCNDCRKQLKVNKKYIDLGGLKVETFYDYDGIFRDLLIQYKECFDEALAPVFLYMLKDYIKYKYHGYKMILMPSSSLKLQARGFNHLELIYKPVGLQIMGGLKMKQELIQEGKNYAQRRKMIENYVYEGQDMDKALIVDDVLTSGSSMLGAYRALSQKANKIRAISLSYKSKTLTF